MNLYDLKNFKVNPGWAKLPLFDRTKWRRVRFGDVVANLNETCDPNEEGISAPQRLLGAQPGAGRRTRSRRP